MPITVTCACEKTFQVPNSYAGRRGKCTACGAPVQVPTLEQIMLASRDQLDAFDSEDFEDQVRAAMESAGRKLPAAEAGEAAAAAAGGGDGEKAPQGFAAVAAPPAEVTIGRKVGGYELQRKLGGPKSSVFLAKDEEGKNVALKVLPHAVISRSPDVGKRFLREAQSMFGLKHANVVRCIDTGEELGTYYLAMEHFDGRSLQKVLDDAGGKLDEDRAVAIAVQVAAGLGYLHDHSLVHRNLKPEHVLVGGNDDVKLIGLGLVRGIEDKKARRPSASAVAPITDRILVGTPPFMSPEQARGKELDKRSDLYALGTVMYRMVTGGLPFDAEDKVVMIQKLTNDDPAPPVREKASEVSRATGAIIDKLLRKTPDERYQTARELITDLLAVQSGVRDELPASLAREAEKAQAAQRKSEERTAAGGGAGGATGAMLKKLMIMVAVLTVMVIALLVTVIVLVLSR